MNRNEKFLDDDGCETNCGTDFKSAPAGITLSDEKIPVDVNNDFIADYYKADIVSAQDYYPFGMLEPQRNFNASTYRFGFNGIEKVNEVAGIGNHYTAKFGEYDSRLGRRWNLDPKPNSSVSSYAMFRGNPIIYSDILLDTASHTPQTGGCEKCNPEKLKDGDYFSDVQDQQYTLKMKGITQKQFDKFKNQMALEPGKIINNKMAKYDLIDRDGSYGVTKGDQFDIDIPIDNGYVTVSSVTNKANFLSVTVQTLSGHPEAGQNTFSASYNANTQTMIWQTHNVSRTNGFILQGVGQGIFNARGKQHQQWKNVMRQVYKYMGKPKIQMATSQVVEFDYNDWTNKVGRAEYGVATDLTKQIKK